jgi:hypothetical protein
MGLTCHYKTWSEHILTCCFVAGANDKLQNYSSVTETSDGGDEESVGKGGTSM